MCDMFMRFPFNVQTLRICCAAWQCIFLVAYPSYETGVITLPFVCFCVKIEAEPKIDRFILTWLIREKNDLNHVLSTFVDSEHKIIFWHSHYVDMSEIQSIFQNSPNEFLILTLKYKVSTLNLIICLALLTIFHLKAYILERSVCKRHGLLVIPICRYCNSPDTKLFTRLVNKPSTAAWLYTLNRIILLKYGIYIPIPIYGNVCLSTSTVVAFVVRLQLGIYTGLLTIITIIQIYNSLYRSPLLLKQFFKVKIHMQRS